MKLVILILSGLQKLSAVLVLLFVLTFVVNAFAGAMPTIGGTIAIIIMSIVLSCISYGCGRLKERLKK